MRHTFQISGSKRVILVAPETLSVGLNIDLMFLIFFYGYKEDTRLKSLSIAALDQRFSEYSKINT